MSSAPVSKRPFYKKKRIIVPAAFLALGVIGSQTDAGTPPESVTPAVTPSSSSPSAKPSPTPDVQARAEASASASSAAAQASQAAAAAETQRLADAQLAASQAAAANAATAAAAAAQRVADEQARVAAEAARKAVEPEPKADSSVYYANCDAVRAAGAAPIRVGDPGYSTRLDRDGDGEGCAGN